MILLVSYLGREYPNIDAQKPFHAVDGRTSVLFLKVEFQIRIILHDVIVYQLAVNLKIESEDDYCESGEVNKPEVLPRMNRSSLPKYRSLCTPESKMHLLPP